ncbi:hypothetical protein ACLMJK_008123 [Lecanora helva]
MVLRMTNETLQDWQMRVRQFGLHTQTMPAAAFNRWSRHSHFDTSENIRQAETLVENQYGEDVGLLSGRRENVFLGLDGLFDDGETAVPSEDEEEKSDEDEAGRGRNNATSTRPTSPSIASPRPILRTGQLSPVVSVGSTDEQENTHAAGDDPQEIDVTSIIPIPRPAFTTRQLSPTVSDGSTDEEDDYDGAGDEYEEIDTASIDSLPRPVFTTSPHSPNLSDFSPLPSPTIPLHPSQDPSRTILHDRISEHVFPPTPAPRRRRRIPLRLPSFFSRSRRTAASQQDPYRRTSNTASVLALHIALATSGTLYPFTTGYRVRRNESSAERRDYEWFVEEAWQMVNARLGEDERDEEVRRAEWDRAMVELLGRYEEEVQEELERREREEERRERERWEEDRRRGFGAQALTTSGVGWVGRVGRRRRVGIAVREVWGRVRGRC